MDRDRVLKMGRVSQPTAILDTFTWRSTLLLLLLSGWGAMVAQAQVRSERYTASSMPDNSIVYSLPKTMLYLEVLFDEVTEEPGELALYAKQYLGQDQVLLRPSHRFSLKGVSVGSYGVPDPERRYSVKFARNSSATYMTLTPEGLLVGINHPEATGDALPVASSEVVEPMLEVRAGAVLPPAYIQATTVAKRAEVAAQELYLLRESRRAIISGESEQAMPDGQAMQLAIERLDSSDRAITSLFTGRRSIERHIRVVTDIDPIIEEESKRVVGFRFSEEEGLLPADDLRGEPIYMEVRVIEEAAPLEEREAKRKERQLRRGVVFAVPGLAEVTLTYQGRVIAQVELPVAQLGTVEALDQELFTNRQVTTAVKLYSSSGAIERVEPITE